jgi:hypothetical protein
LRVNGEYFGEHIDMGFGSTPNNRRGLVEHRRRKVAALRLRGLSLYEIVDALASGPAMLMNPETGDAFGKSTIDRDLRFLEREWRKEAVAAIAEHKAIQLAELREARRKAWSAGDVPEVRQNIALEMRLLGTEAPTKIAPTDPSGDNPYTGLNDDELRDAILRAARAVAGGEALPLDNDGEAYPETAVG